MADFVNSVFHAPMSFFDTNPKGRVVNRFAKDVDYVDRQIPMTFSALLRLLFSVVGTIGAICYATPVFIAVIVIKQISLPKFPFPGLGPALQVQMHESMQIAKRIS